MGYPRREKAPCLGCIEREVTDKGNCHTYCKSYLEFRAKRLEEYKRDNEREEAAYLADVNKRVQKARNRRRKSRI